MHGLLDFDVAIEPLASGYRVRVVTSPAGEAYADFALPFTGKDLEILILKVVGSIGRARRKTRRIQSDERRLLETFGGQLFQAVFSGPVHDCLGRSRLVAESRGAGLRIRLRLPGALANVPWEYLYDAEYGFIGLSPETALVRYVELPAPVSPLAVSPPLRVLAMISAPVDVPELQGDEEWGKLNDALGDLTRRGTVQVDRLEAGTLAALQRPLRLHEYHVLHFIGHGYYDDAAQDGALALEGPDRKMRLVTGRDLGMMIRGHRSLRLVVLNACEGARSAADDPLGGVAQALVRQGIPAVIAMQFEISDPAALVFSKSFYQAIADDLPVDVAMVEARKAIFAEGHEVEWATPVLYLRSPDGRIFSMGQIPGADRQAREDTDQRDRDLAARYALACSAADAQDWDRALAGFTMLADADPGYRDVQERAENARNQQQIARWQAETRRLHEAGQWASVVKAGQRLHALDPAAADPDGLVTSARAKLAASDRSERLDADYETAQRYLDVGNWREAIEALERVAQVNPAYRATPALLDRARRHLTSPAPRATTPAPPPSPTPIKVAPSRLARTLTGHTGWVFGMAFSPDGRLLATASATDGTTRVWDVATGNCLRTLSGHSGRSFGVAFSPDGRLLATTGGNDDKTVRLWDPATGKRLHTFTGHTGNVGGVAFSPDGRLLATVGGDSTVRLWDPATGKCLRTLTAVTDWPRMAPGDPDLFTVIFTSARVMGVAFSPDGRLLATAGGDKTVGLWDSATGKNLHTLTGHSRRVLGVAFSPAGRLLATAGGDDDKTVRLWDPATGKCLHTLTAHSGWFFGVAFSPAGRLLATAGDDDKTVRLWDPATGKRLHTLTGHTGHVSSLAFSPDGRLLATAGDDDKTARLWDPATGKRLHTLTGHTGHVSSLAFSPHGRLLATADDHDYTVRLWD